jgi:hypothetical protein
MLWATEDPVLVPPARLNAFSTFAVFRATAAAENLWGRPETYYPLGAILRVYGVQTCCRPNCGQEGLIRRQSDTVQHRDYYGSARLRVAALRSPFSKNKRETRHSRTPRCFTISFEGASRTICHLKSFASFLSSILSLLLSVSSVRLLG